MVACRCSGNFPPGWSPPLCWKRMDLAIPAALPSLLARKERQNVRDVLAPAALCGRCLRTTEWHRMAWSSDIQLGCLCQSSFRQVVFELCESFGKRTTKRCWKAISIVTVNSSNRKEVKLSKPVKCALKRGEWQSNACILVGESSDTLSHQRYWHRLNTRQR